MSDHQPYPGKELMEMEQKNEPLSPPNLSQPTQYNGPNTTEFLPYIDSTHDITMAEEDLHTPIETQKESSTALLDYNESANSEAPIDCDQQNLEKSPPCQDQMDYEDPVAVFQNQADWVDPEDLEDLPSLIRCDNHRVMSPIEETTEISDQDQDREKWVARLRETRCNTEFPWGQQAEERREKEAKRASENSQKDSQPVSKSIGTDEALVSNNQQLAEHGKYFFSYSHDMDPNWMTTKRNPPFTGDFQGLGVLMNYSWQIGIDSYATIIPAKGENVFGMVYLLSHEALFTLDEQDLIPGRYYVEDPLVVKILGNRDVPLKDEVEEDDIFQNDGQLLDCRVYVGLSDNNGIVTSTDYANCLIRGFHAAMSKGMPVRYVRDCLARVFEGGGI